VQFAQQAVQHVAVLTRGCVGDPAHALRGLRAQRNTRRTARLWQVPDTAPGQAGCPLAIEQALPVLHHRATGLDHDLVPVLARVVRVPEIVGHAGTADEHGLAVDQHDLAMVAVQVAEPQAQLQRVVQPHFDAGAGQPFAVALAELEAAEAIEQATNPHTPLGRRQ